MGLYLKQSTAATLLLGPFVDEDDGKTAETGLTITYTDVQVSKNGGSMATKNNNATLTADLLGYYTCPISATDTNTVGRFKIMVHESGALPVWADFNVLPANSFDSIVGGTDYLQTDVIQIEGTDATDQLKSAITATVNALVRTIEDTVDAIPSSTGSATWNGTASAAIQGAAQDALNAYDPPTLAELQDEVSALATVNTEVAKIPKSDSNVTWNATALASIQAEAEDAVQATLHPDVRNMMEANGATYRFTALALANAPTGAASPTGIADAVWDEAIADHVSAGSMGLTINKADFTYESSGATYRFTAVALANAPTGSASPTGIADAVWDEVIADHVAAGSFGITNQKAVPSATIGDYAADVTILATINTEVGKIPKSDGAVSWNATALAAIQGEVEDGIVATVNSVVRTVEDDTNELQADWTNGGRLDLLVDTLISNTNSISNDTSVLLDVKLDTIITDTGTTLPNQISALNNVSTTNVRVSASSALVAYDPPTNTELTDAVSSLSTINTNVTAILADTAALESAQTELASLPTSTGTPLQKINAIWAMLRNKCTTTSTAISLKKEDASTELSASTISDDGTTFTKGEFS